MGLAARKRQQLKHNKLRSAPLIKTLGNSITTVCPLSRSESPSAGKRANEENRFSRLIVNEESERERGGGARLSGRDEVASIVDVGLTEEGWGESKREGKSRTQGGNVQSGGVRGGGGVAVAPRLLNREHRAASQQQSLFLRLHIQSIYIKHARARVKCCCYFSIFLVPRVRKVSQSVVFGARKIVLVSVCVRAAYHPNSQSTLRAVLLVAQPRTTYLPAFRPCVSPSEAPLYRKVSAPAVACDNRGLHKREDRDAKKIINTEGRFLSPTLAVRACLCIYLRV